MVERGRIEAAPYEGAPHARVIGYLFQAFRRLFAGGGAAVCLDLPVHFDQTVPDHGALPDLIVALGRKPGPRSGFRVWEESGPPDVAIDVTSPSTALKDRMGSRALCQKGGVPELLSFDPLGGVLEMWQATSAGYRHMTREKGGHLPSRRLELEFHLGPDRTAGGSPFTTLRVGRQGLVLVPPLGGEGDLEEILERDFLHGPPTARATRPHPRQNEP